MADDNGGEVRHDKEEEVSGSDSGTEDIGRAESTDEGQTVRDVDFDTSDIDSRLDSIEQMMQRVIGTMTKLTDAQSVLVESGAVIDTADEDPSDDDGMSAPIVDDVFDLRIDD